MVLQLNNLRAVQHFIQLLKRRLRDGNWKGGKGEGLDVAESNRRKKGEDRNL